MPYLSHILLASMFGYPYLQIHLMLCILLWLD